MTSFEPDRETFRAYWVSADVDSWAAGGVGFVLSDDFADDRRGVAAAQDEVPQQVAQWVSFGPLEVAVRRHGGGVAQSEQDRGNGVGNSGAVGPQNAVAVDLDSLDPYTSLNVDGSTTSISRNRMSVRRGTGSVLRQRLATGAILIPSGLILGLVSSEYLG
jgi:hypothetical protein